MISPVRWRRIVAVAVIALGPALLLEVSWLVNTAAVSWFGLIGRWGIVVSLLGLGRVGQPYPLNAGRWVWPWWGLFVVPGLGGLAGLVYAAWEDTNAAWLVFIVWNVFLFGVDRILTGKRGFLAASVVHGLLALAAGVVPVVITQLESHFADEEFFVALQAAFLALFWLLALAAGAVLERDRLAPALPGLSFHRRWLGGVLVLAAGVGTWTTVRAYQRSFYPLEAPAYAGISESQPFLCGEARPDPQTFDGRDVFQRLLARVEANPRKKSPEYGMLALGTGDRRWAEAFRESLLAEAEEGLFTGPVGSVKFGQYEAALRGYYYPRVRAAFPGLFSAGEEQALLEWFAAINRRARTVEWVDWLYALALGRWPTGLYENQENGAGLLAVLESGQLSPADLTPGNQAYLAREARGWAARFRNTDDAIIYQPEWINNALFQAQVTGQKPEPNLRLSFDWLLLQALPSGAPLRYNHTYTGTLAGVMYLGAQLTGDARYLWLAGRTLDDLEKRGEFLFAQPGVEYPLDFRGQSPSTGSCLIYGDSGLPTQPGPLAPDKIVFRSGWGIDDTYLLLNLRFTGWHRYKATNTITLLDQYGPLVVEENSRQPYVWLPIGRSLFRDKRIPRENLNGLLIARMGLSAVLYTLTGVGGPWAQDPPYYARVERFETNEEMDISRTVLENWHGWKHQRLIYFYHSGPILIFDDVRGPARREAALVWHLTGETTSANQPVTLRAGEHPIAVALVPLGNGVQLRQAASSLGGQTITGSLQMVTVFLLGDWFGAEVKLQKAGADWILHVKNGERQLSLPLKFAP